MNSSSAGNVNCNCCQTHALLDETEGAFKRAHAELLTLERTSDPLNIARPPGCLVSFVGVQRLLGSPFRIIDSATAEADTRWLQERVEELTQPALRIFAHLGLESGCLGT